MKVAVVGAGVAGLCCATELMAQGVQLDLYDRGEAIGSQACSWFAGGMLAPWCERENAHEAVLQHGKTAIDWWRQHTDCVQAAGSLVVASPRDNADLKRFASRTSGFSWQDSDAVSTLEPELGGRFMRGLFFDAEAHLNPRDAIISLAKQLVGKGARLHLSTEVEPEELDADVVLDCRGYSACDNWPELRGVKGEMLILRSEEVSLHRPVRLLHPRIPLYVVPRAEHHYMVGATMIENSQRRRFSARSMLELLGAAYALHPAFAEAEIVETGVDVRPAFENNLPRLRWLGRKVLQVNGLYRHGFLLGPALAKKAAHAALNPHLGCEPFQ